MNVSEIRKEVYKRNENQFGFRIYAGDQLIVQQDFKPNVAGWQPMNEIEANMEADKMLESLKPVLERNLILEEIANKVVEQLITSALEVVKASYIDKMAKYNISEDEIKRRVRL
jgi:hypothetical protein